MSGANTLIAINILQAAMRTGVEVSAMLQKAAQENRNITDEEVKVLRDFNDSFSAGLLDRLKQ